MVSETITGKTTVTPNSTLFKGKGWAISDMALVMGKTKPVANVERKIYEMFFFVFFLNHPIPLNIKCL